MLGPRYFSEPRVLAACFLLALAYVTATGCKADGPEYVEQSHSYDTRSVTLLLERSEAGSVSEHPVLDAKALRQDALTSLRRQGDGAAKAASLITSAFPGDATGVPYYVERATYEGK